MDRALYGAILFYADTVDTHSHPAGRRPATDPVLGLPDPETIPDGRYPLTHIRIDAYAHRSTANGHSHSDGGNTDPRPIPDIGCHADSGANRYPVGLPLPRSFRRRGVLLVARLRGECLALRGGIYGLGLHQRQGRNKSVVDRPVHIRRVYPVVWVVLRECGYEPS